MQSTGYNLREEVPLTICRYLSFRETSPYVNHIRLLWQSMRGPVMDCFLAALGLSQSVDSYLQQVDDVFVTDAYNSLSIEGYQVTHIIIERVRQGQWNPNQIITDQEQKNALAARGYWQAYKAVRKTIKSILQGQNAGDAVENDHRICYWELSTPSVSVGLLNAGYRMGQVHIRGSKHVPFNQEVLRDVMLVFFGLL